FPAVGPAHHHPDLSTHPEIDLGLRRVPIGGDVEPAPHHLGAGPCVEHVLGRGRKAALDTHHVAGLLPHRRSFPSSKYSPTTSNRRSQRPRWVPTQSEAAASASGRNGRRWVLPSMTRLTTRASSSVFRWREIAGLETSTPRDPPPTVPPPPLSRST